MKLSFPLVALLGGLASAQTSGLPACANDCVTKFTSGTEIGSCGNLDAHCICSDGNFLSNIACCLAAVCSVADQQAATLFAQNYCKTAGVTNLPSAVSCTSTSSLSSTASSVASSGSSTMSSSVSPSPSASSSLSTTTSPSVASTTTSSLKSNAAATAGIGVGVLGGMAAIVALL